MKKNGGATPADVQGADKAVYAVFHGISFKDIARNGHNDVKMEDGGQYVHVFSLMGEQLVKYILFFYSVCPIVGMF